MEIRREEDGEMEMEMSVSPPSVGSMQIAGSNGFGHSIEFMSQAYLRNNNRYSEIDIQLEDPTSLQDRPLPIFLKVPITKSIHSLHITYICLETEFNSCSTDINDAV